MTIQLTNRQAQLIQTALYRYNNKLIERIQDTLDLDDQAVLCEQLDYSIDLRQLIELQQEVDNYDSNN